MSTRAQTILEYADRVEAEMTRIGLWGEPVTAPPRGAFGSENMAFEQWLQSVFLPNVRRAAAVNRFPPESYVAVAATRNFDGWSEAQPLIGLLQKIDDAVMKKNW